MKRVLCHLAAVLALELCASRASATSIMLGAFAISPPSPTTNDSISLGGTLLYPTTGFQVTMIVPLVGSPTPNQIVVDVFVSSPGAGEIVLDVLTSQDVSAPLGKLAAGSYDWLLAVHDFPRGSDVGNGSVAQTGTFTVPEPGAFALFSLALLTLTHGRLAKAQSLADEAGQLLP
jgi:hypothetical protein